jgi:tetratricopeptide (TPR) repeat protein
MVYGEGCALLRAGRHEAAAACFTAALREAPDFADAAQNLGCCQAAMGQLGEAARSYRAVVRMRTGDAGSHFNLGCVLLSAGEYAEALAPLQEAARLAPRLAKHHQFLGLAFIAAGRKPEAVPPMLEAVRLDGTNAVLVANVAGLLVDVGEPLAAVEAGLAAVRLAPETPFAQANLARALHCAGRSEQALAPALAAVRLAPDDGGAVATLGAVQYMLGDYAHAAANSRRAAELAPELYQAKANESVALEALGHLAEAEAAGREAITLAPSGNAEVRHNLACMLLRSGRMTAESWAWYDCRLQLNPAERHLASLPRWAGEDVAGKTVLLHAEQGFGDTIQFARYAPLVKALGARVILAVQPALCRLLADAPGTDCVVSTREAMPPHDVFCPLLSLPGVFGTTLGTIPPLVTVVPDSAGVPPQAVQGLQVGLVWAGSPGFVHDRARSVGLDAIGPLADVPGIALHSLQFPAGATGGLPIIDRMADVADFADTASRVAGLDLVIAVDSAVAHLAATMGREVWLLSRFLGCWRWLQDRDDSPWYPGMRIYRQTSAGDWTGVIERVSSDLAARAASHASPHGRAEAAAAPLRRRLV